MRLPDHRPLRRRSESGSLPLRNFTLSDWLLAIGCSFVRPPERGDSKVEKNRHNSGGEPESFVVAGVMIGGNFAPERGREDDDRKQEENSRDFEPEDSADAPQRTQEAADAARDRLPGLAQRLSSLNGGARSGLACGNALVARAARRSGPIRVSRRGLRGRSRLSRQALFCDAPCGNARGNAHSDAERAANSACSHTVYDGSSGIERSARSNTNPQLAGLDRSASLRVCPQTGLAVR